MTGVNEITTVWDWAGKGFTIQRPFQALCAEMERKIERRAEGFQKLFYKL